MTIIVHRIIFIISSDGITNPSLLVYFNTHTYKSQRMEIRETQHRHVRSRRVSKLRLIVHFFNNFINIL